MTLYDISEARGALDQLERVALKSEYAINNEVKVLHAFVDAVEQENGINRERATHAN